MREEKEGSMKITIHAEGSPAEIAKQLLDSANVFHVFANPSIGKAPKPAVAAQDDEEVEEKSAISVADLKEKKRGRPPGSKNKAAAKVEAVEDDEEELDDEEEDDAESIEDEAEEDDETEEESEDAEEDEDEGLSETDLSKLKAALKAYSAKNGKEKAVKILNKFAKASQDVKPADLPKVLKLLKV